MKKIYCIFAGALILMAIPAFSEVITFQDGVSPTPDYAGTGDTHIISWDDGDLSGTGQGQLYRNPDGTNAGNSPPPNDHVENPQNMGGFHLMEEGDNGGGSSDSKVLLVQFLNLDDHIPPASAGDVRNAQIGLYFDSFREGNENPSHTLYVNRILKRWAEGDGADPELYPDDNNYDGTDTPDNSGAVTWNSTGFELWQAMGAEGPEDIAPPESELFFDVDAIQPGDWVWFDVTESAQIWIADPEQNHGVKIGQEVYPEEFLEPDLELPNGRMVYSSAPVENPTEFPDGRYVFRTSEHEETETHPQLVIELGGLSSSAGEWSIYK